MGQHTIEFGIDTTDTLLAFDLMGTNKLSGDASVEIGSGVRVIYNGSMVRKAEGVPETANFLIELAVGVPVAVMTGLASTWIYDKLKGKKVVKLTIQRREVELEQNEIKKVIEEIITKEWE